MFAKFACANRVAKFSAVNLLNSGVVLYLPWSGVLFSIAVRAVVVVVVVVVAKLVMLGILFLTSFMLALRAESPTTFNESYFRTIFYSRF